LPTGTHQRTLRTGLVGCYTLYEILLIERNRTL